MFPPVAPDVLARNPHFRALYTELTTKILNPQDESTRARDAEGAAVLEQDLRTYRAELARMQILRDELLSLTGRGNGFTDEINDIIDIIATASVHPTALSKTPAAASLLTEELDDFKDALPLLAQALSHHLTSLATALVQIADPTSPPPATPSLRIQQIELLPAQVAHRRAMLAEKKREIDNKRVEIAKLAGEIIDEWRGVVERTVGMLEDVKFGAVERGVRAKAGELEAVVAAMEAKMKVLKYEALAAIYSPESLDALENYHHHLVDTKSRLQARQRTVEEELKRYDRLGSDMRALVTRYSDAMRGIESVTREIGRLEGRG